MLLFLEISNSYLFYFQYKDKKFQKPIERIKSFKPWSERGT
jgi:hypothetical protein